ncbi:hypothetical protein BPOR_2122g00010 [Botrytis porri]|uniref:Uncharacterized protein n=1 Tax=Botrytis porri TaxID=87229 RepID=A0A4Z1JWX7_9HELO|nr:hypothetical protein BPOR_2122g00010 [Botrytis porri]
MLKRPAASVMSSFLGSPKKQGLTKPIVKDYISLSEGDLISKKYLEVVQLLMDLRGAYQQLQTLNEENATENARLEVQIAKVAAKPRTNTAAANPHRLDVIQQARQLQGVMCSSIRAQMKWAYVFKPFIF